MTVVRLLSVGREGNSADVCSLLRIPVKGSQEAEGKANAETAKKVNSTWYAQKPTKRPDRMKVNEVRTEM